MGLPLIAKKTKGEKEKELDDLEDAIASLKGEIDGVVTGALASSYQKMRIDSICKRHDLLSIAPLWHRDPVEYLHAALHDNFEIIIVGVGILTIIILMIVLIKKEKRSGKKKLRKQIH